MFEKCIVGISFSFINDEVFYHFKCVPYWEKGPCCQNSYFVQNVCTLLGMKKVLIGTTTTKLKRNLVDNLTRSLLSETDTNADQIVHKILSIFTSFHPMSKVILIRWTKHGRLQWKPLKLLNWIPQAHYFNNLVFSPFRKETPGGTI